MQEAQSVIFYGVLIFWGRRFRPTVIRGGSAEEGPHLRGGYELGSYEGFVECIADSSSMWLSQSHIIKNQNKSNNNSTAPRIPPHQARRDGRVEVWKLGRFVDLLR